MRRTLQFAAVFALAAISAAAQNIWSATAATGVPNFNSTGDVRTTTIDATIHGRGVRPQTTVSGVSFLYVPVTAPQGSTFNCIGLRGMDNSPTGSIRAEFIRQPRGANPAAAVTMGGVATADAAGDGFQFVNAVFAAQVINYLANTYYVRIAMLYQPAAGAVITPPTALDVSLGNNNCTY